MNTKSILKYAIRVVKSFIFFIAVLLILLSVIILITPEYSFDMLFSDQGEILKAGSWPKILVMFALFASIYPALSYVRKETVIKGTSEENRAVIMKVFESRRYFLSKEDDEMFHFRQKSAFTRFLRLFEDEVTLTKGESPLILSGIRKEIIRISSDITYLSCKSEDMPDNM